MIRIYKSNLDGIICENDKIVDNCWIDLINPTMEEVKNITEKTGISSSLLVKVLDYEELPRIEVMDGSTLLVVAVPYIKDMRYKEKYSTIPVGIIIKNNFLLTVCLKKNRNIG